MPERAETMEQLLARIRALYGIDSDAEIARRVAVSPATVHTWRTGKRGSKAGPRTATLDRILGAFPELSRAEVYRAAGRPVPGALTEDVRERAMRYFEQMTEEQQALTLTQMRAVVEGNRSTPS
jgi:hypothetical protein